MSIKKIDTLCIYFWGKIIKETWMYIFFKYIVPWIGLRIIRGAKYTRITKQSISTGTVKQIRNIYTFTYTNNIQISNNSYTFKIIQFHIVLVEIFADLFTFIYTSRQISFKFELSVCPESWENYENGETVDETGN